MCDDGNVAEMSISHGGDALRSIGGIICFLLPSVFRFLLAFLVLLSAFMLQTGCSAIWLALFSGWPAQLSGACRLGGLK